MPLTGTSSRMRSLPVADVSRLNFHSVMPPQPMQPHLIRPDPNVVPAADAVEVVVNRKCVYTYEDKYTFARILVSDSLVFGMLSRRKIHLRCHAHVHFLIYMYTMLLPTDSHFESGNLHSAFRIFSSYEMSTGTVSGAKNHTYDLYIHNDVHTTGHTQWFYFSVSNTKAGNEVTFQIRNFSKTDSLFNDGMYV